MADYTEEMKRDLAEIRNLLTVSTGIIGSPTRSVLEIESAAWRIADAGGLLRAFLRKYAPHDGDLMGVQMPTGRGFCLPVKENRI